MKKAVIAVMVVIMTLTAAFMVSGCTDEAMQIQIDSLMDRVEDLENKNNVFWTDKTEYAETETMTVRLNFNTIFNTAFEMNNLYFNYFAYVTSLVSDINAVSVLGTSYITCETASCLSNPNDSVTVCYKGKETSANGNFRIQEGMQNAASYDFVICVPGTAFELARFADVTVET